jgi:general nucleoside transport system ATP-binding protein
MPKPKGAMALEICDLSKRFGSFTALDAVSLKVQPGHVHALLGENGAGKSTLVKCLSGFHQPDGGSIVCDHREQDIADPIMARELGIGMVYQHFTLANGMSVAENLLLAGGQAKAIIDWTAQRHNLKAFLVSTPFQLDLDALPGSMSAGEKQKLELLKQLYLKPRLLILDEPTSVLTPQEADEVLGHVREIASQGLCTVLLITHKFREVMAYADTVTVLRRGSNKLFAQVSHVQPDALAKAMVGENESAIGPEDQGRSTQASSPGQTVLQVKELKVLGDRGHLAVNGVSVTVRAGEILGVAGVSGNGQREWMEALVGQRPRLSGTVQVSGEDYQASRTQNHRLKVRSLPEEPLRNACVAQMSLSENMALRDFDLPPLSRLGWIRPTLWRQRARQWIEEFGIKSQGETATVQSLSGGNLQRTILARELHGKVQLLIVMNPVFGLDFAAVREIHHRIQRVRQQGGAVLLFSEDLDELLELSDRMVVMSEGELVHEVPTHLAQRQVIGTHMAGGMKKEPTDAAN